MYESCERERERKREREKEEREREREREREADDFMQNVAGKRCFTTAIHFTTALLLLYCCFTCSRSARVGSSDFKRHVAGSTNSSDRLTINTADGCSIRQHPSAYFRQHEQQ
jgi:hypothetical protein